MTLVHPLLNTPLLSLLVQKLVPPPDMVDNLLGNTPEGHLMNREESKVRAHGLLSGTAPPCISLSDRQHTLHVGQRADSTEGGAEESEECRLVWSNRQTAA